MDPRAAIRNIRQHWLADISFTAGYAISYNGQRINRGRCRYMQTIGYIDVEKYQCISKHICTDEVIITPERVRHIKERRGEDFYEQYAEYFSFVLSDPDYIFKDKHENTAIACKRIGEGDDALHLVVRLVVVDDPVGFKNSVLTAIKENKKRFAQRLRNNVPVYKKIDIDE